MPRRYVLVAVCIALTLLCAGMLFTAIQKVREAAARMICAAHFSQTAFGLHNYASANGDILPAGTVPNADLPPEQRLSWVVPFLPYREAQNVHKQFDLTRGPGDPRNAKPASARFEWAICPSSGEREYDNDTRTESWKSPSPLTHYVGVAGVGADAAELPLGHPRAGIFGYDRRTAFKDITDGDGTSNTLLLIETTHNPGHWAYGGTATVRAFEGESAYIGPERPFGGFHSGLPAIFGSRGRCQVAFADGHYRVLTDRINPAVLEALATVGGKEELPANW